MVIPLPSRCLCCSLREDVVVYAVDLTYIFHSHCHSVHINWKTRFSAVFQEAVRRGPFCSLKPVHTLHLSLKSLKSILVLSFPKNLELGI